MRTCTNPKLPILYLTLEKGLELIWESGEPMELWIFYFYEVFSRAFGEEGNGGSGDLEWKVGDVTPSLPTRTGSPSHPCSSGCYSYPKPLAAADVATNTVAFSDFYIYFTSSFILIVVGTTPMSETKYS